MLTSVWRINGRLVFTLEKQPGRCWPASGEITADWCLNWYPDDGYHWLSCHCPSSGYQFIVKNDSSFFTVPILVLSHNSEILTSAKISELWSKRLLNRNNSLVISNMFYAWFLATLYKYSLYFLSDDNFSASQLGFFDRCQNFRVVRQIIVSKIS